MKTNWKYDILFSFKISFTGGLNLEDFTILPSNSCKALLNKHNLSFKTIENVSLSPVNSIIEKETFLISEKRIYNDEIPTPVNKINKILGFTFLLNLKQPTLLEILEPFKSEPSSGFPKLYGQHRLLYFDNLNSEYVPDTGLTSLPKTTFPNYLELFSMDIAANETVSELDFASLSPKKFVYNKKGEVNGLKLKPMRPTPNDELIFNLTDQHPQAKLSLEQGGYHFEQIGGSSPPETIFSSTELVAQPPFGVIQIYKDEFTDYNKAIRYNINFE